MKIKLKFSTIDRSRWSRSYTTVEGARKAILRQLGTPELGSTYAVSGDGICKVEVSGDATLNDLFPREVERPMKSAKELAEEYGPHKLVPQRY